MFTPPGLESCPGSLPPPVNRRTFKKTNRFSLDHKLQEFSSSTDSRSFKAKQSLPESSPRFSLPTSLASRVLPKLSKTSDEDFTRFKESLEKEIHLKKNYVHIELICNLQWGSDASTKTVMQFVDAWHSLINKNHPILNLNISVKRMAELIFLIDNHPEKALLLLDKKNIESSLAKIHASFQNYLKKLNKSLEERHLAQIKVGHCNPEVAKHMAVPIRIAKILIPKTGLILDDLIPQIIKEFVNETLPAMNYLSSLKAGLETLTRSKELKKAIESVGLVPSPGSSGSDLIKMTLHLPFKTSLKEFHVRRTILSALLTHLRQGKSASCFASFIAIELKSMNPLGAVKDFEELLSKGKLTRSVDGVQYDFPYLLKMHHDDVLGNFTINSKGLLTSCKKEAYFWEFYPVFALGTYLCLESIENTILKILKQKNFINDSFAYNCDLFIADLAKLSLRSENELQIVFNSAMRHPLLAMWENSIAGMAEALKESMLKSALFQSVLYVAKKGIKKKGALDVADQHDIFTKIINEIKVRSYYLYDPSCTFQNSPDGAFILYDSCLEKNFSNWIPVNSFENFRTYLKRIMDAVFLDEPVAKIKPEFKDKLLISLLRKYHNENENMKDVQHIPYLRFTPWITAVGNDPRMVLKVYNQNSTVFQMESITPDSPKHLLECIQKQFQCLSEKIRLKYLTAEQCAIPIRIKGVHSFSLLVSHRSFHPFLEDTADSEHFEKHFSSIASNIALSYLTNNMKRALCDFTLELCIRKKQWSAFEKHLQTHPETNNIINYRKNLMETIAIFNPKAFLNNEIGLSIDLKFIQLIPRSYLKLWERSIIHFADTNWQAGVYDIHYGLGFNPGSGQVEIVSVLENGKIYRFLNQAELLNGKVWEIYYEHPEEQAILKRSSESRKKEPFLQKVIILPE